MKKKVIAVALYIALLMTSLIPATALAEGEPEGGAGTPTETPVCTCDAKCSEGKVNSECPVCSAEGAVLAEVCQGAESQTPDEQSDGDTPANEQGGGNTTSANGQGDGQNPPEPTSTDTPVCICTAKCSEGAVNEQCPVCGADWSSCAFTEESGEPEPDSEQEPDKGPESVTVTEWSWVDDMKALAEDGKLYLGAAVTEENLEGIIALLPQYIQAGEEQIALA